MRLRSATYQASKRGEDPTLYAADPREWRHFRYFALQVAADLGAVLIAQVVVLLRIHRSLNPLCSLSQFCS